MMLLLLAALLWLSVHIGIAGTALRGVVVARIGEGAFRGGFSALSAVAMVLLVMAYNAAATTPIWYAPFWLRAVLAAVMLPVFVLFVAALVKPKAPGAGIQRITRHPMMNAFALWAAVHVLGNGDTASIVFFGSFLVTAVVGMPSIDAKLAKRDPQAWAPLAASTSILPFGAILAGRNHLVLREIGWLPPALGLLAWMALLHFHGRLFGAMPLAG